MNSEKFNNKVDFYKFILKSRVNTKGLRRFHENSDVSTNDLFSKHHTSDSFIYFANKFDFSETKEEMCRRLNHRHYSVKEYEKLQNVHICPKLRKIKKALQVALTVTIISIIAGGIAAFTDITNNNSYENTLLIDRIDRLVRAVELDWGR